MLAFEIVSVLLTILFIAPLMCGERRPRKR
jgi:hypothetical protein